MVNVTEFFSNNHIFRAVSDTDKNSTAINLKQCFTNEELMARSYAEVCADFLAIVDYAHEKSLTRKSDSIRALAFYLTTRGIGNLWFDGIVE